MTIEDKTGLVLEGGGMRGVFTCGVLDWFMDNGVRFPFAVGVSAGACNGLSYMSGQRGRAKASNPARFVMVTTNCLTGKAEYLEEKQSAARVMDIVRASSSLPYVTKITHVDGVPMLDGGIADSLPVEYALSQRYERLVVVLTRNKGYRKYPLLQKALQNRNAEYNRVMELIEKLEDEGYAEASKVLSFF